MKITLPTLRNWLLVISIATFVSLLPAIVYAETIVVDTDDDSYDLSDGQCSLREAIVSANTNNVPSSTLVFPPGGPIDDPILVPTAENECEEGEPLSIVDTIVFSASLAGATIELISPDTTDIDADLDITESVTISGLPSIAINGDLETRLFDIANADNVTISGLTLEDGRADANGGAIRIQNSAVTIQDAIISGNFASAPATPDERGGGIYVDIESTLTLIRTTLSNNEVEGFGGAIENSGELTVVDSRITANRSSSQGGGIYNNGAMTVTRSTISNNCVDVDDGGGIYNAGTLLMTDSAIGHNQILSNCPSILERGASVQGSSQNGGGLYNVGMATLINVTITGNEANNGGGIYNSQVISLTHVTVTDNEASSFGGGLYNYARFSSPSVPSPTAILVHSLIAGNRVTDGGVGQEIYQEENEVGSGSIRVDALNLFGHSAFTEVTAFGNNFFPGTSDIDATADGNQPTALTTILNPLADNGGATQTHALPGTSPAVDAAGNCAPLTTDQRGEPRPQGLACDIGAYEATPVYTLTLTAQPVTSPISQPVTLTVTVSDQNQAPGIGLPVELRGTGVNPFSAQLIIDSNGRGIYVHDQGFNPGLDTVNGWVDLDTDQILDVGAEPTATVSIEWQPRYRIALSVPGTEELIGVPQRMVATLVLDNPNRDPVSNREVNFQIAGTATNTAIILSGRTDPQGVAVVAYTRLTDTVKALDVDAVIAWLDLDGNIEPTAPEEPLSNVEMLFWRGMTISFKAFKLRDIPGGIVRRVLATVLRKGQLTPVEGALVGFAVTGDTTFSSAPKETDNNGEAPFEYPSFYPVNSQIRAAAPLAPLAEKVTTWIDLDRDNSQDDGEPNFFVFPVITAVKLRSFVVKREGESVLLRWETGVEEDNSGFHLERAAPNTGAFVQINRELLASRGSDSTYEFIDVPPDDSDYLYRLIAIDTHGGRTEYGPVSIGSSLFIGEQGTLYLPLIQR